MNPIHTVRKFTRLLCFVHLILLGCSSKCDTIKKQNVQGQYIFRKSTTSLFSIPPPQHKKAPTYAWRERFAGKHPRITKEFFRCKGNPLNPVIVKKNEAKKEAVYYRDCGGAQKHGLPLRNGKEFIYPTLINILNYLQEKTEKKVVITTGHRCRDHNTYADATPSNFGSKHMMGAEVDFYIEGMQTEHDKVIALIQEYYRGRKGYEKFERYEKEVNVSTKPWLNKEIFVKLYLPSEGRDIDNQHLFPYIGIQLRYDCELDKKIMYDDSAAKNYLRY